MQKSCKDETYTSRALVHFAVFIGSIFDFIFSSKFTNFLFRMRNANQISEGNQLERVTRRTDFSVNLETTANPVATIWWVMKQESIKRTLHDQTSSMDAYATSGSVVNAVHGAGHRQQTRESCAAHVYWASARNLGLRQKAAQTWTSAVMTVLLFHL
jgi:hypothetical protein